MCHRENKRLLKKYSSFWVVSRNLTDWSRRGKRGSGEHMFMVVLPAGFCLVVRGAAVATL